MFVPFIFTSQNTITHRAK